MAIEFVKCKRAGEAVRDHSRVRRVPAEYYVVVDGERVGRLWAKPIQFRCKPEYQLSDLDYRRIRNFYGTLAHAKLRTVAYFEYRKNTKDASR